MYNESFVYERMLVDNYVQLDHHYIVRERVPEEKPSRVPLATWSTYIAWCYRGHSTATTTASMDGHFNDLLMKKVDKAIAIFEDEYNHKTLCMHLYIYTRPVETVSFCHGMGFYC